MNSLLVLIGGPTCSGKTSIARAVCESLSHGTCSVIGLDSYYCDLSHLPPAERAAANFDHPDAFDWPLLKEDLDHLLSGGSISVPVYDFACHVRSGASRTMAAAGVLIVEGILALYDEELCRMSRLRVFVDAADAVSLGRRIERDSAERGRTEASVRNQFDATVVPMANAYVRPTKARANLVLESCEGIADSAQRVIAKIAALRDHG